jgi:release factor glutamine methyltransferase
MATWTTKNILDWAVADFKKRGLDTPRLDAELLLADVLACNRIGLYTDFDRPLTADEQAAFRNAITQRRDRDPVAYILRKKEFWSLDFEVTPAVLVPRPETETLVACALEHLPQTGRLLDLCTGSGCVAVSIALERPDLEVDAADISAEALEVAARNVSSHGLSEKITLFCGDLFEPLPAERQYHGITVNPPYVPEALIDSLSPEVQKEPAVALRAGPAGLDVIERILIEAPRYLLPGGALFMEIDPGQAQTVAHEMGRFTPRVEGEVIRDLSGRERVVVWQRQ